MPRVVIEMTKSKETKNTIRYEALDDGLAVDTVYVQKSWLGTSVPTSITVTVEAADE